MALCGISIALGSQIAHTQFVGVLIMLLGCTVRAVFIIMLNDYAKEQDAVTISILISAVVSVISFIVWFFLQPATFGAIHWSGTIIASLFIYAYFIIVFAQTLNIFAQKRATAAGATVIYSLEIAFSLLWGAILPESLVEPVIPSLHHMIGALLIVAGSMIELIDFSGIRRDRINVSQ